MSELVVFVKPSPGAAPRFQSTSRVQSSFPTWVLCLDRLRPWPVHHSQAFFLHSVFRSFHRICRSIPSHIAASEAVMCSRRTIRRTLFSVEEATTGFK